MDLEGCMEGPTLDLIVVDIFIQDVHFHTFPPVTKKPATLERNKKFINSIVCAFIFSGTFHTGSSEQISSGAYTDEVHMNAVCCRIVFGIPARPFYRYSCLVQYSYIY